MYTIKKTLAVASLTLGLTGFAHAIPTVTLDDATVTAVSGATTIDFEGVPACGYASCTGDFTIFSNSVVNQTARPAGSTGNFLSVPNPNQSGTATFGLGASYNYFGLLIGSFDSYNTISFLKDAETIASFTGTQLYNPADGNQNVAKFVNFFFDSGLSFDAVVMSSNGFAFESDNHAYANVPEPGTLALLGLGLLGLGVSRRARA